MPSPTLLWGAETGADAGAVFYKLGAETILDRLGVLSNAAAPVIEGGFLVHDYSSQLTNPANLAGNRNFWYDLGHLGTTISAAVAAGSVGGPPGAALGLAWGITDATIEGTHYVAAFGPDAGKEVTGYRALMDNLDDDYQFRVIGMQYQHPEMTNEEAVRAVNIQTMIDIGK